MALENEYIINVDIKKQFTSRHIAFRRGDNGVIVFRLFDDGEEYNINTATKAILYQRTPSGMSLESECQFTSIGGKRVIRYEYEEVAMVEIGYNTLVLVIYEGNEAVSLQPFNVTIYDDLQDGADSYLELIQDLMKIIDDLVIDLNNTIKLSEKGVPNGVATLDKDGKIPLSQMPNSFQSYINHITETVYLNKVHGMSITTDGIMQYTTPNGIQNVGFAPEATGGGGSGGQVLSATVKVDNGIATVTYSGAPSVNSQKWAIGDRNKAYFATNGTIFNGQTFSVKQVGSHTLWYKDSNGNEYVVLFVVASDQLAPMEIGIMVEDGVVSVNIEESAQIKKWDVGTRTIEYFQYNGTIFNGNAFTVTDAGTYTVYIKTVNGVESVRVFDVTEEMLPSELITPIFINIDRGSSGIDTKYRKNEIMLKQDTSVVRANYYNYNTTIPGNVSTSSSYVNNGYRYFTDYPFYDTSSTNVNIRTDFLDSDGNVVYTATTKTSSNYNYMIINNEYVILTRLKMNSVNYTVPDKIEGLPVVDVGTSLAVNNTSYDIFKIENLTLPPGVLRGGRFAFTDSNLKSVKIENPNFELMNSNALKHNNANFVVYAPLNSEIYNTLMLSDINVQPI